MSNLTSSVAGAAVVGLVTIAPFSPALAQMQPNPAWTIMKPDPTWSKQSTESAQPAASPHKTKAAPAKRPELASRKEAEASQQHRRKLEKSNKSVAEKTNAAAGMSETPFVKPPHHVVIQVTQNDPAVMNMVLNNAENLTKYYGDKGEQIEIELVAYGPGLHMLRSDTSPVKGRLAVLAMENVTFSACGNTMNAQAKQEGKEITLVPEARMVPAGIARIMELQEQHWTYVRP
jgi:intracellular sulfur oxidation DsrE/DsrF family protein